MGKIILLLQMILISGAVISQTAPEYYGAAGEGFSSSEPGGPVSLSYRMFTAPMAEDLCKNADQNIYFKSAEPVITLEIGEIMALSDLRIDAINSEEQYLSSIPVTIGLPEIKNGFILYKPYELTLQAVSAGTIQIEVMGYCIPESRTYLTLNVVDD